MHAVSERGFRYYDEMADAFHRSVAGRPPTGDARWIVDSYPRGTLVVDAGCGTGEDSAYLAASGMHVYAYDASQAMCAKTQKTLEPLLVEPFVVVRCHDHLGLHLAAPAQVILASASLLFLTEEDLATVLRHLGRQLDAGGVLLASFKEGAGARPQPDGRTYYDRGAQELVCIADMAGLEPAEVRRQPDVLGRRQGWVTFVLRRTRLATQSACL